VVREVQDALRDFEFLKVDTDTFPAAARHFDIVGLPTLLVLDGNGNQLFRHLGPIGADPLVGVLAELRRR
jgi:hypothetical protein